MREYVSTQTLVSEYDLPTVQGERNEKARSMIIILINIIMTYSKKPSDM